MSQAGLVDIEKALRDVLWPLVEARQAQFSARERQNAEAAAQDGEQTAAEQQLNEMLVDDSSAPMEAVAASIEAPEPEVDLPAEMVNADGTSSKKRKIDDAWPKQISKRAKVRAAKYAKAERVAARLQANRIPLSSHEIILRSGRALVVPDNSTPERFRPTLLLNKRAAIDSRPAICSALTLGINAVTAILEHDVENARRELAGLKPAPRQKRDNLDLRLFIPAPNKSTRRQRRELRQKLIPRSQAKKRKHLTSSTSQRDIARTLPQFLHNVPAGDPAVLHVLQEALQEISIRITTKSQPSRRLNAVQAVLQEIITIASGDTHESQQSAQTGPTIGDQTAMALDTAPGGVDEPGGSQCSLEAVKTVNLPSTLLYTIFCGKPTAQALQTGYYRKSLVSESHLQDLTALLVDCDRQWFAVHEQYVKAAQTLEPPVQKLQREVKQHIPNTHQADQAESGARVDTFSTSPRFRIIFVAKGDINPLSIVQHVLTAAAARNAANISLRRIRANADSYASPEDVYIVPLPKGAESKLAELLGIRRVAVFAIEVRSQSPLPRPLLTKATTGQHRTRLRCAARSSAEPSSSANGKLARADCKCSLHITDDRKCGAR